jgi:hypothetical protein
MLTRCTSVNAAVSRILDNKEDGVLKREALDRTVITAGAISALKADSATKQQLARYHSVPDVSAYGVKVSYPEKVVICSRSKRCGVRSCTVHLGPVTDRSETPANSHALLAAAATPHCEEFKRTEICPDRLAV